MRKTITTMVGALSLATALQMPAKAVESNALPKLVTRLMDTPWVEKIKLLNQGGAKWRRDCTVSTRQQFGGTDACLNVGRMTVRGADGYGDAYMELRSSEQGNVRKWCLAWPTDLPNVLHVSWSMMCGDQDTRQMTGFFREGSDGSWRPARPDEQLNDRTIAVVRAALNTKATPAPAANGKEFTEACRSARESSVLAQFAHLALLKSGYRSPADEHECQLQYWERHNIVNPRGLPPADDPQYRACHMGGEARRTADDNMLNRAWRTCDLATITAYIRGDSQEENE
jgi:hypothetical protein